MVALVTADPTPEEVLQAFGPPLWVRMTPLVLMAAMVAAVLLSGAWRELSFENIRGHREDLQAIAAARPWLSLAAFALLYAAVTALSIPGALVLTLTGGFLFGAMRGSAAAILGATAGATVVFLIVRLAAQDSMARRLGPRMTRFREGFRRDAFAWLLSLRLAPIAPFWLVNLVAPVLGAPLRTFVTATFLGVIPTLGIYASVGAGLGRVFDRGEDPHLGLLLEPGVLLPLIGLALLSLVPVAWRLLRRRPA